MNIYLSASCGLIDRFNIHHIAQSNNNYYHRLYSTKQDRTLVADTATTSSSMNSLSNNRLRIIDNVNFQKVSSSVNNNNNNIYVNNVNVYRDVVDNNNNNQYNTYDRADDYMDNYEDHNNYVNNMDTHGDSMTLFQDFITINDNNDIGMNNSDRIMSQMKPLKSMINPFRVLNVLDAQRALKVLKTLDTNRIWACDTEVADIDLKMQGPVGNGRVICVSIYGGPDVNFSDGSSTLWIENDGQTDGLLQEFKAWFEDEQYKKVWHNYGFDRHVMFNEGIDCRGFAGDTMHMARLWDTSREKTAIGTGSGYSLESLSNTLFPDDDRFIKVSMMDIFGRPKKKNDGGDSKIKVLPDVRELQNNMETRDLWIDYSARDAVATWHVRDKLITELRKMPWTVDGMRKEDSYMSDYYQQYLCPFGELLTEMERNGIKVDTKIHLKDAESRARAERLRMETIFLEWATTYCSDVKSMNIASSQQIQQLLFGEYENFELKSKERVFKIEKSIEELKTESEAAMASNPYVYSNITLLKSLLKERGLKLSGKKDDLVTRLLDYDAKAADMQEAGIEGVKEMCRMEGVVVIEDSSLDDMITAYLKHDALMSHKESLKLKRDEKKMKLKDVNNATAGVGDAASKSVEDFHNSYDKTFIENELNTVSSPSSLQDSSSSSSSQSDVIISSLPSSSSSSLPSSSSLNEISSVSLLSSSSSLSDLIGTQGKNATAPKKHKELRVTTIGLTPTDFTPSGVPQVSANVLKKLAGKNLFGDEKDAVWGTAFEAFKEKTGDIEEAKRACKALGALAQVGQVDATITNFLVPLQALVDENSRIHCSLNLNTETGRLSSRRPNLQNQPALEKDQYKIRDAFIAEEGKTFIVADYGQLELRVLAHITKCKSMIEAFSSGGCFHSRTAVGMYDYIKDAVASGKVMLEWDYSKGQPTVPLVKDTYASERRKAKTLNFSIAYGKTVHGLAQDWGITKEEAQDTLDAWYRDRPEVKKWQDETQAFARRHAYVFTIMGRWRRLQDAKLSGGAAGHALRAAINTPIQGSAADIVMMAMIKLWKSPVLKELGWKLLLQIHDEVILEGPIESKDEAMKEVRSCMERPHDGNGLYPLSVTLDVDAKSADSWYKAK